MIPDTSIESVFDAMVDVAPSAAVAMLKETRELAKAATDIKDFRQAWQDELAVHFHRAETRLPSLATTASPTRNARTRRPRP